MRLESEAAAAGRLAREEKEKADEAEAAYKEAEEKCAEQSSLAQVLWTRFIDRNIVICELIQTFLLYTYTCIVIII